MGLFKMTGLVLFLFVQQVHWVSMQSSRTSQEDGLFHVELVLEVKEGYHIQAVKPDDPYLIPTTIELALPQTWELVRVDFPEAEEFQLAGSGNKMMVYSGDVTINILIDPKGAAAAEDAIPAVLQYQACDDSKCYYPRQLELEIALQ